LAIILQAKEKHFFVGALWATIGIIVTVVATQLLRDYAPGPTRVLGILGIVAWVFFWFGRETTANLVYRLVDALQRR